MPRIVIVSHTFHPEQNGQAIMLGRVTSATPETDIVRVHTGSAIKSSRFAWSHRRSYALPSICVATNWRTSGRLSLLDPFKGAILAAVAKRSRAEVLVGCTGPMVDMSASLTAARVAACKFIAYYFDWFSLQDERKVDRRRIEEQVMEQAACVIVPNEFLKNDLAELYACADKIRVVRNPTAAAIANEDACDFDRMSNIENGNIVYTGDVYDAQEDSIVRLSQAIQKMCGNLKLTIYTRVTPRAVADKGIGGRVDVLPHIAETDIAEIHRQADILYLPLSFNYLRPKLIRTSAPGKLGDYLAAGRPILAHVPADSFVAHYLETNQCGVVVSEPSSMKLREAIERIFEDVPLRTNIQRNAVLCARRDFGVDVAANAFNACVKAI